LSQLRQREQELGRLGIEVCVVTFDDGFLVKNYVVRSSMTWPLLIDKGKRLYESYGMERGSWWSILNPVSLTHYIRQMLKGTMPGRPGSDSRQLGGDVLIDPAGVVRLQHVSKNPHDRPSVDLILRRAVS
jgi:alkyl hydroperoxide reductase subunit AhpC